VQGRIWNDFHRHKGTFVDSVGDVKPEVSPEQIIHSKQLSQNMRQEAKLKYPEKEKRPESVPDSIESFGTESVHSSMLRSSMHLSTHESLNNDDDQYG